MVKNKELEDIVLGEMYNHLKETDESIKIISEGDAELGKGILRGGMKIMVDTNYRVRIHVGRIIGYGYDFRENDEMGHSTKETYDNAIENTKKFADNPHFETLIVDGKNDKFGWYITKVG